MYKHAKYELLILFLLILTGTTMRLALQTDFALRSLMYLAWRGERVTAADVAAYFGISTAHVAKVANQLAKFGFVRSIRGVGGGIELARPAGEISIAEVVTAFEGPMHLLDCVATSGVCVIESFCKLKRVLSEAERVQLEYLESVSLEEVLPTKRQIAQVNNP